MYGSDGLWDTPVCFIDNDTIAVWAMDEIDNRKHIFNSVLLGYNIKTSQFNFFISQRLSNNNNFLLFAERFTDFAVPDIDCSSMVFDDYLYCLNQNAGIDVVDPKHNVVYYIENKLDVHRAHCYNKYSKQFLANKKENDSTLVLSYIKKR